jgi:pyruvate,water dikinase
VVFERIARVFRRQRVEELGSFKALFEWFQQKLKGNNRVLELISELEDKLSGDYIFDINYLRAVSEELSQELFRIISSLNTLTGNRYQELFARQAAIQEQLNDILEGRAVSANKPFCLQYDNRSADIIDIVGNKIATLTEIRNRLGMDIPDGFVVTTAAYRRFMQFNDLWPRIRSIYETRRGGDKNATRDHDRAVDALFDGARMPSDVAQAVSEHLSALSKRRTAECGLAVRSSACGEDGERQSFAGQFESFLNCKPDEVLSAYAKVLASRFKHVVGVYSERLALDETALEMAVGVQQTIPAVSSGVLYSVDPSGSNLDSITIAATFGFGIAVVGGTVNADSYHVSRLDAAQVLDSRIGNKKTQFVPGESRGIESAPVTARLQQTACLTPEQVTELARRALLLERYFKRPVDVEWCFDGDGKLYILQCRPLILPRTNLVRAANLKEALGDKPTIMRGKGVVAQRGIAAGTVWHVDEDDDPGEFPVGAIAVTKYTTPRLTAITRKAAAIITDVGSSSGHMATIAREFGVPMIVSTGDATRLLRAGDEVTVDAEENIIYAGIVKELLAYDMEAEDVFRDLDEYIKLRQLLRRISPLFLIDPKSSEFHARNCRTYHDIVRFSHEKAVQHLINLNMSSRRFRGVESKKIDLSIPLGLSVIDLGGGLRIGTDARKIESLDQIASAPLSALLRGMTAPGAWSTQPTQLGFGDLVSSLTRYTMTDRVAEYQGSNLAVISDRYANMSLRLGYHFNVIDTYVSPTLNDNYIYFRFVGGVTESERRHLRAVLIAKILERLHFKAVITGDLVVARLKKWESGEMLQILEEIGRLIGFTRQLDTRMHSEASVQECFKAFFEEKPAS